MRTSDPSLLATPAQRQAAAHGFKVLMPVGRSGRLVLDFVLARLRQAGVREVVVVAPPAHELLDAHLARHPPAGLEVRIAVQPVADGTAAAVAAAAPLVRDEACLVVNGDNLYPVAAMTCLATLEGPGLAAFTRHALEHDSGFTAPRLAAFARVEADDAGWLIGIDEKPAVATLTRDSLFSMNLWRFDRTMLTACGEVPRSARGEHELPDAVMLAVRRGSRVRVVAVAGTVLDLTSTHDVAAVGRALDDTEVMS